MPKKKGKMPEYLYDYHAMTHGEFRLDIFKVVGEDEKFYHVVNGDRGETRITKSHVDNFELSPTGYHYCVYSSRNDDMARKILKEDIEKSMRNQIIHAFNELNERLKVEQRRLDSLNGKRVVIYKAKEKS